MWHFHVTHVSMGPAGSSYMQYAIGGWLCGSFSVVVGPCLCLVPAGSFSCHPAITKIQADSWSEQLCGQGFLRFLFPGQGFLKICILFRSWFPMFAFPGQGFLKILLFSKSRFSRIMFDFPGQGYLNFFFVRICFFLGWVFLVQVS